MQKILGWWQYDPHENLYGIQAVAVDTQYTN